MDYRKVNSVTETVTYPLSDINEILESLSGWSVFSTIDLTNNKLFPEKDLVIILMKWRP